MYCKLFTSTQAYDGMSEITIACNEVRMVEDWFCLFKEERFVASFDRTTINGWVLIDSKADTPQTDCGWSKPND